MCNPQGIIDNIIGKAMDAAFQGLKCTIHYKKNHKDLKDEMEKFKEYRKDIIERKVEEAQNRGEDILAVVSSWRREADEMTQDFDNFMQQCTHEESMLCFAREGHFDEIARPKSPPPELLFRSDDDYEIFDSRASVFKMVIDALKDSKVTAIGVHGTGGVGKTTLVKEVSKQLKEDGTFDEVVMAVVSKDANVSKIQSQLVGSVKLGIPVTDGNKGCKVVITSRNQCVLRTNMKVDRDFALPLLPEPEAWALFKKMAGNSVDSPKLCLVEKAVCKECKGLPVTINALGAALKDKEISAWKTALVKLKKSMLSEIEEIEPAVYNSLKLSYEELKKPRRTTASLAIHEWKMLDQLGEFDLEVGRSVAHATLFAVVAQPTLLSQVIEAQQSDKEAVSFRVRVTSDEAMDGWTFSPDSGLRYRSRLFVL
ncbi:hypothetical protein Acr_00g0025910 [Actinidia rufa]|uniref:NB-ARC domain-containing protein n=1 Tax=Actinidia rufa TaxID=165716 RepID=A0A7J0DDG8_9ERIC|nr:hypothetical protein Acr_00g0025910 [Actinidia rufa]